MYEVNSWWLLVAFLAGAIVQEWTRRLRMKKYSNRLQVAMKEMKTAQEKRNADMKSSRAKPE